MILDFMVPAAMQSAPDDHTPHDQGGNVLRMALKLADGGNLKGAISLLDIARVDGSMSADESWLGKARVCARAGYLERALRCVEKSRDGDIHDDGTFAFRADMLYRMERYDYLERWCNTWMMTDESEKPHYFLSRARLMHAKGDAAGARRHVEAILVVEPGMAGAHELYGDMLAAEDAKQALRQYGKALEADRTVVHVYAKTARLLAKTGRRDLAVRVCRRGLRARPHNKIMADAYKAIRDGA